MGTSDAKRPRTPPKKRVSSLYAFRVELAPHLTSTGSMEFKSNFNTSYLSNNARETDLFGPRRHSFISLELRRSGALSPSAQRSGCPQADTDGVRAEIEMSTVIGLQLPCWLDIIFDDSCQLEWLDPRLLVHEHSNVYR